jgi:hypothetical protein
MITGGASGALRLVARSVQRPESKGLTSDSPVRISASVLEEVAEFQIAYVEPPRSNVAPRVVATTILAGFFMLLA